MQTYEFELEDDIDHVAKNTMHFILKYSPITIEMFSGELDLKKLIKMKLLRVNSSK